jgi:hypothetical protein
MGTGGSFPGREADHSPPTSAEAKKKKVDLYIHSHIHLHGVVLDELSTGTTLLFKSEILKNYNEIIFITCSVRRK